MAVYTGTAARRCHGKRRHPDRASAERHLEQLVKQTGTSRDILRAYRCDGRGGCGGWHVGHRMPTARRR